MAEPIVWEKFLSENDVTWTLVRGRIGLRQGDLMVKGEGSTPVILSPKQPMIEWNRYEAVEITMLAEDGREIKIRIGDQERKQNIGPLRQYNTYRFEVGIEDPGVRPLAVMPTDSLTGLVAIRSIRLIPRKAAFPQPAGRQFIGKRDQYRNTLYVHSPARAAFTARVPGNGRLHFGMGITDRASPIAFRVTANGKELFARQVTDVDSWTDADVDLGDYGGQDVRLSFETASAKPGAVALWANPLLTTREPKRRPNILIYMIDTLRADHSSLYGSTRDTTPFLKKLGAQGLVFDDCQVQSTWTKPSTASLLTSLYSFTHGIVQQYDTIPPGAATLAEQFRAAGYVTAAVLANPFAGRITGLQRGFDYLDEWAAVQRYRTDAEDRGTDSAAVNKLAFPWLDQHRDEPFFLYVHTTDPHAPYRPPAGFEEKFANPAETAAYNRVYMSFNTKSRYGGGVVVTRAAVAKGGVNPDRFIKQAMDRYDGEIRHNDYSLEQLVDKLKQAGVLDDTLIVVVSDHGEEFWEHGWTAHGHSLYQELTHGVLVMWNPRLIAKPGRIAEPVQLIDVMPTVLDLAGLKIPDVAQGQSLAPFAKGQPFRRRGLVMTSRFASPEAKPGGVPENRTATFALLDRNWKLIYRDHATEAGVNRVELYDRRADRGDLKNLAAQNQPQTDRMLAEITRWIDRQKQIRSLLGKTGKVAPDSKTIEHLRSLGYLGGNP